MTVAEFPEKTFESSYFAELTRGIGGNPTLFSPSQVFEELVGFDAAVDPGAQHIVWEALNLPRPRGVVLFPTHWTGSPLGEPRTSPLPRNPVSLILQYKRPEYLRGSRAMQWNLWHSPYYRFKRDATQHSVLKRLETNLLDEAVVRYAAPAFHTLAELEVAQLAGSVIQQTGHVAPSVLGGHQVWTYQEAGQPGRGNPNGPWQMFEPFGSLFEYREPDVQELSATQEVALFDGLRQHLRLLAGVARDKEPALRQCVEKWRRALGVTGVPEPVLGALTDFVTVQSLLDGIGAGWLLADGRRVRPAR